MKKIYDTDVKGGKGKLRQVDREHNLKLLLTTNMLKRLEISVKSFRLILGALKQKHNSMLAKTELFENEKSGSNFFIHDHANFLGDLEAKDDNLKGWSR